MIRRVPVLIRKNFMGGPNMGGPFIGTNNIGYSRVVCGIIGSAMVMGACVDTHDIIAQHTYTSKIWDRRTYPPASMAFPMISIIFAPFWPVWLIGAPTGAILWGVHQLFAMNGKKVIT